MGGYIGISLVGHNFVLIRQEMLAASAVNWLNDPCVRIYRAAGSQQLPKRGDDAGSVPRAGAGYPGQDTYADKDDDRDHHVESTHLRDDKGPRNAANDKSKTDEVNYQGHDVASWVGLAFLG